MNSFVSFGFIKNNLNINAALMSGKQGFCNRLGCERIRLNFYLCFCLFDLLNDRLFTAALGEK